MKYRLKKDLPFAKAGEEVIFEPDDNIYTKAIADGDCYNRRLKIFLGTAEDLLRRDWIEEAKPKEVEVSFSQTTNRPIGIRVEGCKYFDPIGTTRMEASLENAYTKKYREVIE